MQPVPTNQAQPALTSESFVDAKQLTPVHQAFHATCTNQPSTTCTDERNTCGCRSTCTSQLSTTCTDEQAFVDAKQLTPVHQALRATPTSDAHRRAKHSWMPINQSTKHFVQHRRAKRSWRPINLHQPTRTDERSTRGCRSTSQPSTSCNTDERRTPTSETLVDADQPVNQALRATPTSEAFVEANQPTLVY
nr:hypothetical protein Iba_scaffold13487CG0010 [Ipomoea batatas]